MDAVRVRSGRDRVTVRLDGSECEGFHFEWHPQTVWVDVDVESDEIIGATIEGMQMPPMDIMKPAEIVDQLAAQHRLYDDVIAVANEWADEVLG